MADDRDGAPAFVEGRWFVVFGNDRSAENGLDTEYGEEPGRDACAGHGLGFRSVATEVGVPGPVGRGAREDIGLLRPIDEIEIGDVAVGNARLRISSFEIDDALAVRKRQRTEKNAIHQAEDGGVRTDPQRERRNRDNRKARRLQQHAQTKTHVSKQNLQIMAGPGRPDLLLQLLNATQFNGSQTSRFRRRCAVADFGFDKKFDSLRQFGRKLPLDRCPSKQVSAKSPNPADEPCH